MSVDVALVLVGGAVLLVGLVSASLQRMWLSAPLAAVTLGVLLGPDVIGVLQPADLGPELRVLEELARVTLAVSLVATGLQMTRDDLRVNGVRAGWLLTVGTVGMWVVTSLGAHLVLGLDVWVALLLGAILTPTDPVVASSLVEGRLASESLPRWLRRSLQLESGANDGLAVGFVLAPLLVLTAPDDDAVAIAREIGAQIAIAVGAGLSIGWLTARAVDTLRGHEDASTGYFLVSAVAMALVVLGATHLLGGSGVLASFIAGVTFSLTVHEELAEELEEVQSGMERLMIVPVFLLFGALLPWDLWGSLGLSGLAFAVWVVVLRRPGPAALALAPTATPRSGTAFLSWFGPLGVAAIYYVTLAHRHAPPEAETLLAAGTLAITASLVVHTLTATPGVLRYAGRGATETLRHPRRAGSDRGARPG